MVTEGPPQPGKSIEDPFKEAEAIWESTGGRIRKPFPELQELVNANLEQWGHILLNAARLATGQKKLKYALTLYELEQFTTEDRYNNLLQSLMTNRVAIQKLVDEGLTESNPLQGLKKRYQSLRQKLKDRGKKK